jgi:hypothetical protein
MQISSFIFILKINNKKSGIPFLPLYTLSASLNRICPKSGFGTCWDKESEEVYKVRTAN